MALNDPYFIEKKLFPNVDFYSGIILSAIGFPTSMFTVLFALARTVGWVAQWNEMISDPEQKIGRPRQALYYRASAARPMFRWTSADNDRALRPVMLVVGVLARAGQWAVLLQGLDHGARPALQAARWRNR